MVKNTVEICANCGKIHKEETETFLCKDCGCDISVVVPMNIFKHMIKIGAAKE